jgi:hypothetical protein
MASPTVVRLTPACAASARSDGSNDPELMEPRAMR